jgi:SAM-dependent methyltransferase
MGAVDRDRRRLSFGPRADLYERYRPGYPPDAIAWLLGESALRVLDVGAGTGKLTRTLLAAGHEVVAVEPDPGMRAAFAAALPGVAILEGAAEELPVADGSFDACVAGQAFHWFDQARALPEIARVLRPGGLLGVIFNFRDESEPWVAELARLLRHPEADADIRSFGSLFGPIDEASFRHAQSIDVPGLLGLVSSRSYAIVMPAEAREEMLAEVEALGRRVAGSSPSGELRLPYVTTGLRARRAG